MTHGVEILKKVVGDGNRKKGRNGGDRQKFEWNVNERKNDKLVW